MNDKKDCISEITTTPTVRKPQPPSIGSNAIAQQKNSHILTFFFMNL